MPSSYQAYDSCHLPTYLLYDIMKHSWVILCHTVVERTKFVTPPVDVAADFPRAATFLAPATSDADTPVTYTWYHDGHQLVNDGVNVYIDASGNLTVLHTDEADLGEYKCVASNGISRVSTIAKLYLPPYTSIILNILTVFEVTCRFLSNTIQYNTTLSYTPYVA